MVTALARNGGQVLESAVIKGDLKDLSSEERVQYYAKVCDSLGLNPYTKPFQYITLSGRLTLYATKDCTEQLRKLNKVSVTITARERTEGVYVVTARASMPDGRSDESIGAVSIDGLKGEALANAFMKAETKSKRRVTLSICGLGMLDETEVETIPDATREYLEDECHHGTATVATGTPPKQQAKEAEIVSVDELPFPAEERITQDDYITLDNARKAAGVKANDLLARIKGAYGVESVRDLTKAQAAALVDEYKALVS